VPIYRTHVSVAMDTTLPRDRIVMTPWFFSDGGDNPDTLAAELCDVFVGGTTGWWNLDTEITSKVYEFVDLDTDTGPPVGTYTKNPGLLISSTGPREIAICLSYYSQINTKRRRGRMYLPVAGAPVAFNTNRPAQPAIDKALSMAQRLADVGGAGCDWGIYSTVDKVFRPISHAWVDNEWDTQRRRGFRGTSRSTAAIAG
jgi:hypothetical protein